MKLPDKFIEKSKWLLYDWLATISVQELARNKLLQERIAALCKKLHLTSS